MEILQKDLGKIAKVDVSLTAGALQVSLQMPLADLIKQAADAAKAKYPNATVDMIIDVVASELEALLNK